MAIPQADIERLRREFRVALHDHWVFYLVEGIILVVLGVAAIILPPVATLAATIVFGWLFLISGVVGLTTTLRTRRLPGFWWALASAIVGIAVGVMLILSPVRGAISLTFLLIAFFFVEGIVSIMFALDHRKDLPGGWGWMLTSGIVDLGLGGLILVGLPGSAIWALGLLVGINLTFGGVALIAMALQAQRIDGTAQIAS